MKIGATEFFSQYVLHPIKLYSRKDVSQKERIGLITTSNETQSCKDEEEWHFV